MAAITPDRVQPVDPTGLDSATTSCASCLDLNAKLEDALSETLELRRRVTNVQVWMRKANTILSHPYDEQYTKTPEDELTEHKRRVEKVSRWMEKSHLMISQGRSK